MKARLQIGEMAKLLGVTTKAIRHFHKIGLLSEPRRSDGGYRLYSADDLLRLHRIKQLQSLGLSLERIKSILGDANPERDLRSVLEALSKEISAQIQLLTARRDRIEQLLAENVDNLLDQSKAPSPTVELMKQELAPHLPDISSRLWEQELRTWSLIDTFAWPDQFGEGTRLLIHSAAAHPESLKELHALGERIIALEGQPEGAPEVDQLADEFVRFASTSPLFESVLDQPTPPDDRLQQIMADLLMTTFSPAQQRFMRLVNAAWSSDPASDR